MWRREPIESVLARGDLDAATRRKLELVLKVRTFARDRLGLKVRGSYASYSYVDREDLSYILTAAPKFDLRPYTWWFLFVGRVPYKGFFSLDSAREEARRLADEGHDTYIRTAAAFSTLGWFDDPLLAHLLRYDEVHLAELIFHELLHGTVFVAGAVDFNESFANFVGHRAAVAFFRDRGGEEDVRHKSAARAWEDELAFSRHLTALAAALRELYGREMPAEEKLRRREKIFAASRSDWAARVAERAGHCHRGFAREELNNAVVTHHLLYLTDLDLFESLFYASGRDLRRAIEQIVGGLASGGEPFAALRRSLSKAGLENEPVPQPTR